MRFFDRKSSRVHAYKQLFLTPNGSVNPIAETVLADLAVFCRARTSIAVFSPKMGQIDMAASMLAEGRREVWLRIQEALNLDEGLLARLRQSEDAERDTEARLDS